MKDRPNRISAPKVLLQWQWRKEFLGCLHSVKLLDQGEPFWTSLALEVLPVYREAQEAYASALRSQRHSSPSDTSSPWHYLILDPDTRNDSQELIRSLSCREKILGARTAAECFSAKWHVDGYLARNGSQAHVHWMREVIYHTLSQWTKEEINPKDAGFHIPQRFLDLIGIFEKWSENPSYVYDHPDIAVASRPLLIGKLGGLSEKKGFRGIEGWRTPSLSETSRGLQQKNWVPPSLPAYNPMGDSEKWKKVTMESLEKAMRKHVRQTKDDARVHGFFLPNDKIQRDWHLNCFALFQVGGLDVDTVQTQLWEEVRDTYKLRQFSLGTVKAAIRNTAPLLDLPLRK